MKNIFLFIVTALVSGLVYAQTPDNEESVRVVRRHVSYDVNADGTAGVVVDYALSPMKRTAIDTVGQQILNYQEGMSEIDILEAYTLKRSGKRIDVPADRILTQSPPAFAMTPMYSDMKIKRMVFADLEVGDQVVYRYKRRWLTPQFPGHFFDTELFPKSIRYDDVRIVLKHAKRYVLQLQARGLTEEPMRESDGMVTREWRYQNTAAIADEVGAVSPFDRDPVFEVTSFRNWGEIASAYSVRAKDKAAATSAIKTLAEEITKGIRDKRRQAAALYNWTTKDIRYVAVYLGAGGYVPHSAESILSNRYGDCKDYTTLLGALLDAKGIANEPVMIDAANRFNLPEVPTPSAFNHAIVYLPDFSLYLDPTARQLPFGTLSALEANKFVLHTRNFKGMMRTPALLGVNRGMTTVSKLVVSSEGAIKGDSTISATGTMGFELGVFLDRLDNPQAVKQITTLLLSFEGMTGSAEVARMPALNMAITAAYKSDFTIDNWINMPGPGAVRLPTGLLSLNSIRMTAVQFLNSPPPKVDRMCFPGTVEETSVIELPATLKATNVPKDVEASTKLASYNSKYVREGNTIKVSRKLEMKFPTTICRPEELAAFREVLEQVRRDTAAQLTYE